MANDRLYIKCDRCNELFFLGKHFGGSWTIYDKTLTEHSLAERLECFLEKHLLECDFNQEDFSLVTEFGDDFPYKPKYFSMVDDKPKVISIVNGTCEVKEG